MAEKKEPTLEAAGNKNMLNILVNAYIDLLDEAGDSRNLEDKYQSHKDRIKQRQSPEQTNLSLQALEKAYEHVLLNAYIKLLDEAGDSRKLEDKYQSHIDRINKETQSPDQRSLKVLKRAYDHIKAKQKEKQ
jgi:hypothetical protein